MDAILARKIRFLGFLALAVWSALQAALISMIYPVVYVPALFPSPGVTRVITIVGWMFGFFWVVWNAFDAWTSPQEFGMGRGPARVAASIVLIAVVILGDFVVGHLMGEANFPMAFGIVFALCAIAAVVIVFDATEAVRIELEAHTAGTKRLNGGKAPT